MLVHPDDLTNAESALARTAAGATHPPIECRNLHADGSYRWLSWTAAPEGQSISAFGRDRAVRSKGVRSRLSPDINSPEDCLCLAKARASRPWRKAQP